LTPVELELLQHYMRVARLNLFPRPDREDLRRPMTPTEMRGDRQRPVLVRRTEVDCVTYFKRSGCV
jgi:hypothetical protein